MKLTWVEPHKQTTEMEFRLEGKIDVLIPLSNVLNFVLEYEKQLRGEYEVADEVLSCKHCIAAIESFRDQISEMIADAEDHVKENHLN